MVNTLQRFKIQTELPEEEKMIYCKILERKMQLAHVPGFRDLFKGGPKVWGKWSKKLKNKSNLLMQMFESYAEMLALNEKNSKTWLSAPIAGHSEANGLVDITLEEGLSLAQNGYTHVAQLFGENYFTGAPVMGEDMELRGNLGQNAQNLRDKCKILRRKLAAKHRADCHRPLDSFVQTFQTAKWSKVYRELWREDTDAQLPGPPSYYTRRKNGIPVPSLANFMTGYDNLFRLGIPSKTLENSFLVMNRQVWTNFKHNLSTGDREDPPADPSCALCGRTEDTMHLLFSCERLSEPCWEILAEGINAHLRDTGQLQHNIQLHAFNVMYNNNVAGLPAEYNSMVLVLIQELKRALVLKGYTRCTTGKAILYNRQRVTAVILITVKKVMSLRQYQGKRNEVLEGLSQALHGFL